MCIIASKPAGIEMPRAEYIRNMFHNNDDGAGLMYAADGKVHIAKGYMDLNSFQDKLDELDKTYGLKNLPLVMHFRITTHGGTKPENCHPFPISDNEGLLKKRKCSTDIGVAHNGIIDITPRKGISDTMEYIISQLAPLKKAVPMFYKNKWLIKMIYNDIDSKMVFLDKDGRLTYIGDFKEESGVKYSNISYAYSYKGFSFPYSCYDNEEDNTLMVDRFTYIKEIMWVDDSEGQYVKAKSGKIACGDFAIDRNGYVYEYNYKYSVFEAAYGYKAYDAYDAPLQFNEEGLVCEEYVSF